MASYFPTNTSQKRDHSQSLHFNPTAESVVLPLQKKKKAATKRERPSNVTVIMMKEYSCSIPKGKVRQRLASEGRILNIRFSRRMSSQEVSNQIIRSFKVASFIVLGCDGSGHNITRCADQLLDGEIGVDRKGALSLPLRILQLAKGTSILCLKQ